jgi:2,5-diketo-D-gluconate reductase A
MTADGRARILADGNQMPMLGLGVWQVPNGEECVNAVRWALDEGYRHIDTAQAHGNEESVGKALRGSGVPRDEVFITTKFYPGHEDPVAEARRSLTRLGVDQVNLCLVHWPQGGATWAWPGMERARELGYARSVGVSNFSVNQLDEVLAAGTIQPAVNQVQFSAPEYRRRLLDACRQRGVALEAYSPLGTGRHLSNETVLRVAKRVGRAPAQVLLRWCVQREVPVITKSTNHEHVPVVRADDPVNLGRQLISSAARPLARVGQVDIVKETVFEGLPLDPVRPTAEHRRMAARDGIGLAWNQHARLTGSQAEDARHLRGDAAGLGAERGGWRQLLIRQGYEVGRAHVAAAQRVTQCGGCPVELVSAASSRSSSASASRLISNRTTDTSVTER